MHGCFRINYKYSSSLTIFFGFRFLCFAGFGIWYTVVIFYLYFYSDYTLSMLPCRIYSTTYCVSSLLYLYSKMSHSFCILFILFFLILYKTDHPIQLQPCCFFPCEPATIQLKSPFRVLFQEEFHPLEKNDKSFFLLHFC